MDTNPHLPVSIPSKNDPLEIVATIYQDYYTGEIRLTIASGYLVEEEFEEVVKTYNFVKYGPE